MEPFPAKRGERRGKIELSGVRVKCATLICTSPESYASMLLSTFHRSIIREVCSTVRIADRCEIARSGFNTLIGIPPYKRGCGDVCYHRVCTMPSMCVLS